jgi:hypothetical protein
VRRRGWPKGSNAASESVGILPPLDRMAGATLDGDIDARSAA